LALQLFLLLWETFTLVWFFYVFELDRQTDGRTGKIPSAAYHDGRVMTIEVNTLQTTEGSDLLYVFSDKITHCVTEKQSSVLDGYGIQYHWHSL